MRQTTPARAINTVIVPEIVDVVRAEVRAILAGTIPRVGDTFTVLRLEPQRILVVGDYGDLLQIDESVHRVAVVRRVVDGDVRLHLALHPVGTGDQVPIWTGTDEHFFNVLAATLATCILVPTQDSDPSAFALYDGHGSALSAVLADDDAPGVYALTASQSAIA